jgi:hypothetical protein
MTNPRRDLTDYSGQQNEKKPALDYDKQRDNEVAAEGKLKDKLNEARNK